MSVGCEKLGSFLVTPEGQQALLKGWVSLIQIKHLQMKPLQIKTHLCYELAPHGSGRTGTHCRSTRMPSML